MSFPGGGSGAKDNAVGATPHARDTVCRGDVRWSRCVWRQQRRQRQQQQRQRQRRRSNEAAANASKCGLGNGQKATGSRSSSARSSPSSRARTSPTSATWPTPTSTASTTTAASTATRSSTGREEQTNPQQVASLAAKLIENDKVLGIVGNTSLIDCAVNQEYYGKQGFNMIVTGVARECYFSPNICASTWARTTHARRGAVLVRPGRQVIVAATLKAPGADFNNSGAVGASPSRTTSPASRVTENVPITTVRRSRSSRCRRPVTAAAWCSTSSRRKR